MINDEENKKSIRKFDEIKYFDNLDVQYKKKACLKTRIGIVNKQIAQSQKNILKLKAIFCNTYIAQMKLNEIKIIVKHLRNAIDFQFLQSNWFYYPIVSRFCKNIWFKELHQLESSMKS